MRRAIHVWCVATALALSVVGPGALVAAGDDGPSQPFPTDRPSRTSLRPTDIVRRDPQPSDKTVILLVSGIGSDAPDGTFDDLVAALRTDPRYEVHRFGGDPAYPYDTTGSINANADRLTAEIRDLAKTHPKIDIVAHSMGGVVVDAALRRGLSANDKVDTYIALASPHDGSTEARAALPFLAVADLLGAKMEFRAITKAVAQDVGSQAVQDLAATHAGPPPLGINRFDVRLATDVIVTAPDAWTPRVTSRTLLPSTAESFEGHGGATTDPRAIALVTSTIASGRPPAMDWRDVALAVAAAAVSAVVERNALPVYCGLLGLALACAVGLSVYRRRKQECR
jgi:pimeloyl-ACP methyl ester carboxylesterase